MEELSEFLGTSDQAVANIAKPSFKPTTSIT